MPRFASIAARAAAARFACDSSLRITGCAHGGSNAWLGKPRLGSMSARKAAASLGTQCLALYYQLLHALRQQRPACDASLRDNGCAHSGSNVWHAMPRFESMAAHTAAASPGTECLAPYEQWLHERRQHWAWHVVPRSYRWPSAWWQCGLEHLVLRSYRCCMHGGSVSFGTWCLALITGCTHGSGVTLSLTACWVLSPLEI